MNLKSLVTRNKLHMQIMQRMLRNKSLTLNNFKRGLIRILTTRMIISLLINFDIQVNRKIKKRSLLRTQRNTNINRNLNTITINRMFSRLMNHNLLLKLKSSHRYKTTIFDKSLIAFIPLQRLNRTPITNLIEDTIRRIGQRPYTSNRDNSITFIRHAIPIIKPINSLNISRIFISRLLLRFSMLLRTKVLNRIGNSILTVGLPQLHANLPYLNNRKLMFRKKTKVINRMNTSNLSLLNYLMVVIPDLSLKTISTNLLRRNVIMRRSFQTKVGQRHVQLTVVL